MSEATLRPHGVATHIRTHIFTLTIEARIASPGSGTDYLYTVTVKNDKIWFRASAPFYEGVYSDDNKVWVPVYEGPVSGYDGQKAEKTAEAIYKKRKEKEERKKEGERKEKEKARGSAKTSGGGSKQAGASSAAGTNKGKQVPSSTAATGGNVSKRGNKRKSNTQDPAVYDVQRILSKRTFRGEKQVKVLWKGYPQSEATWEPASAVLVED
jgi:hypothetical protein